jgi:riboflavin synthase alpha subunit
VLTCRFPHLSSITLSHHGRYAFCATPEADMSVAIHQGKSIYMAGICIDISGKFLHKHFSVLIIIEDRQRWSRYLRQYRASLKWWAALVHIASLVPGNVIK